jgi:cell wall-associated NlpC family hydrolase
MALKRIYLLKFGAIIGLSALALCIFSSGSLREKKIAPQLYETIIKDTLINQVKTDVHLRDSIVNFGLKFLGTPYVSGGYSKKGFDCSGFVYFVFNHFKIQVPRGSSQYNSFGKEIPIDSVREGDILIFLSPTRNEIGHVGIVTNPKGRESDFIHASSGSEMKVIISSLKQPGYKRRFVKAADVL